MSFRNLMVGGLTLVIAGCNTTGSGARFEWDKARQVKVGMTKQEVINLLGTPSSISTNAEGIETLRWANVGDGGYWTVQFPLKNGRVFELPGLLTAETSPIRN